MSTVFYPRNNISIKTKVFVVKTMAEITAVNGSRKPYRFKRTKVNENCCLEGALGSRQQFKNLRFRKVLLGFAKYRINCQKMYSNIEDYGKIH